MDDVPRCDSLSEYRMFLDSGRPTHFLVRCKTRAEHRGKHRGDLNKWRTDEEIGRIQMTTKEG